MKKEVYAGRSEWEKKAEEFLRQPGTYLIKFTSDRAATLGFHVLMRSGSVTSHASDEDRTYHADRKQVEILRELGIPHECSPSFSKDAQKKLEQKSGFEEHPGVPHQWEITNLIVHHSTKDPSGHVATLREECQVVPKHIRIRKTHIPTEEEKEMEESYERTRVV